MAIAPWMNWTRLLDMLRPNTAWTKHRDVDGEDLAAQDWPGEDWPNVVEGGG
jgi:hypothetical protein